MCDRLVGGLGIGPKYLVDEYAILDARYWVLGHSLVAWVCYLEFFIMMPLELLWYIALQRKHWSRHYWAIVTGRVTYSERALCATPPITVPIGTFQLMGTVFYVGAEASDGYHHLVGVVSWLMTTCHVMMYVLLHRIGLQGSTPT